MKPQTIVIPSRFCGPPKSGNGGYVCGRIAAFVPGAASIRLKAPPPLESRMRIEAAEGTVRLLHDSKVIAEGRTSSLDVAAPSPPTFSEAEQAAKSCTG